MALVWVPFAAVAHAVAHNPTQLQWVVAATLVFSFAHQPLTLWLTYGDATQRQAHRVLFTSAPATAVVAIAIGSSVRPELVALIGAAWNVGHTIRQRYGISRLYGRLKGIDCSQDNRLLWSWLTLAVLVAVGRTDLADTARAVGLGESKTTAIDVLNSARVATAVLVPAAVAVAIFLTARAATAEWKRPTHSTPRLTYLGSTAALLVVLAIEPVTGFVAYIGSHAAEYLFVTRWRIDRAAQRPKTGDRVGAVARRIGGRGTIALYAGAVAALIVGMRQLPGTQATATLALTLGALHLLYDGFIWRSPRPATTAATPGVSRAANLPGST